MGWCRGVGGWEKRKKQRNEKENKTHFETREEEDLLKRGGHWSWETKKMKWTTMFKRGRKEGIVEMNFNELVGIQRERVGRVYAKHSLVGM